MLQEQGEELCILIGQALLNIIGETIRVEVGTGRFKAPDIGSIGFAFANINIQFRNHDIQAFGVESQDRILDGLEGNVIELPVPLDADALDRCSALLEAANEPQHLVALRLSFDAVVVVASNRSFCVILASLLASSTLL